MLIFKLGRNFLKIVSAHSSHFSLSLYEKLLVLVNKATDFRFIIFDVIRCCLITAEVKDIEASRSLPDL